MDNNIKYYRYIIFYDINVNGKIKQYTPFMQAKYFKENINLI